METIQLAQTDRTTTRLGFGGSSIMGALNRRESLALLEGCVEAGITHFDTAPSYGFGQAEGCLGDLLMRHAGNLTVTTKYGIPAAKNPGMISLARSMVKPLIKAIPGLKKRIAGVAGAVVRRDPEPTFSVEEARASLEKSLKALRVGRIDVWLLHEASAGSLTDERLLRFMEDAVSKGDIGTFGIGSEGGKIAGLMTEKPGYCRVLQYEWSVMDATLPATGPFRMHHRALTENFRALHGALAGDAATCRRWSEATGQDLQNREVLANLMLKASLVANPSSVILFSSKNLGHVQKNVQVAEDDSLAAPAEALHGLVRSEGAALLRAVVA